MLINEAEKIVRFKSSSSQWHAHKHTAGQMVFSFTKKAYCTFLFLFQSCQKCDACARVCACAWEQAPHKHPHQREALSRPAVRQESTPEGKVSKFRQEDVSKVRQNKSRCQSNRWQPGRETLVPTVSCQRCH